MSSKIVAFLLGESEMMNDSINFSRNIWNGSSDKSFKVLFGVVIHRLGHMYWMLWNLNLSGWIQKNLYFCCTVKSVQSYFNSQETSQTTLELYIRSFKNNISRHIACSFHIHWADKIIHIGQFGKTWRKKSGPSTFLTSTVLISTMLHYGSTIYYIGTERKVRNHLISNWADRTH